MVGVLFQPPSEMERDLFWDDDYETGSIHVWLKRKYLGPYVYGGQMEHPEVAKQDVARLLDYFKMVEVGESFEDYLSREKQGEKAERKPVKKAALIDLTLEEMHATIMIETGTENLLERLKVSEVIAAQSEKINLKELFPLTKELIYNYDFGDNWIVKISKYKDCVDLLEDNRIDEYELKEAKEIVLDKHKPVCINKEGLSVLDDVVGLA